MNPTGIFKKHIDPALQKGSPPCTWVTFTTSHLTTKFLYITILQTPARDPPTHSIPLGCGAPSIHCPRSPDLVVRPVYAMPGALCALRPAPWTSDHRDLRLSLRRVCARSGCASRWVSILPRFMKLRGCSSGISYRKPRFVFVERVWPGWTDGFRTRGRPFDEAPGEAPALWGCRGCSLGRGRRMCHG